MSVSAISSPVEYKNVGYDAARMREVSPENLISDIARLPKENTPIGNWGIGDIRNFIDHALAGFAVEAFPLVKRGNQRIDIALRDGEEVGSNLNFHRMHLHHARALGTWLELNQLDESHWIDAQRFEEATWRFEQRPWTRQEIVRDGGLDDYMAFSVLGGNMFDGDMNVYEAGIDMFEYWVKDRDISFKKTLKPRELGYAMCLHYARQQYDPADLLAAGRRMLAANLDEHWLGRGRYREAATWLMAVYWYPHFHGDGPMPDPVDTLLRAYDDMPRVVRPF